MNYMQQSRAARLRCSGNPVVDPDDDGQDDDDDFDGSVDDPTDVHQPGTDDAPGEPVGILPNLSL